MKNLIQKFSLFILFVKRYKHPETYIEELEYQCGLIVPPGALISLVAFLPYFALDKQIHPEIGEIFYLRAGLSVVALMVLILFYLTPTRRYKSLIAGTLLVGYLEIATATITGLTGPDPVYLGGYLFITMIIPLAPLPRFIAWPILGASFTAFAFSGLSVGFQFDSPRELYSLNDILTTVTVAAIFIYILDAIRYRSWSKSVKIESLLLNILPSSIAEELKNEGFVQPKKYESATVVFTDFVGFTSIAEKMTPEELVEELHRCFKQFDRIVKNFNLEKLKTIGDSYMYAGGVPQADNSHSVDAVLAAMKMQDYMRNLEDEKTARGESCWHMRLGINTGPLMAGVVGEQKYVYDVFGDSVNLASRMESSGESGEINISATTRELIKDFF